MLSRMSGVYSKAVLRVGTYHSPDGVVHVTPERLKHWERETQRLQRAGYAIPSHFDHADLSDQSNLEPIENRELVIRQSRRAQNTVGALKSFKLAPDGQSAEIVLNTLTPKAQDAVSSNAVYVSPVIMPSWKDGANNRYSDIITSWDLVDHPVDHSQSSFVPAIRMGHKPYIFSGICMSLTKMNKIDRSLTARKARLNAGLVRLGLMKPDDKKPPMGEDSGGKPDDHEEPDGDEGDNPEKPSDGDADNQGDYDTLDQVLDLLHEFGITLPEDTSDEDLVKHLRVALTALLRNGKDDQDDPNKQGDTNPMNGGDANTTVAAPTIATMSLTGQAKQYAEYAEKFYRGTVEQRIQSCLKDGKCTPAEADARMRELSAVRLSLDSQGTPAKCEVERWLDAREPVPAGTFWTDKQRTEAPARLSLVEPKSEWTSTGGPTTKEIDEAVRQLL